MPTSRAQPFLIAALAMGLGLTLTSSVADGYPAGPSVSLGANPVVSIGGSVEKGASGSVITAESDMDLVITDVSLGMFSTDYYCKQLLGVRLYLDDGTTLGQYTVLLDIYRHGVASNQTVNMQSGIRVPAGQTMNLSVEEGAAEGCSNARVDYTLAGYSAQP